MPPEQRRGGIGAAIAAAEAKTRRSMLRGHGGGHAPVSFLELFFDLVFVFAITQLSHFLKANLSWTGFAEALVMFLAVWWAWMSRSGRCLPRSATCRFLGRAMHCW